MAGAALEPPAQGDGASMADALVRSFETLQEMRPRVSSTAAPKIAMRLAQMQMGDASPVGAAADLAAILAAQAAMVAAITAASSSAAVPRAPLAAAAPRNGSCVRLTPTTTAS